MKIKRQKPQKVIRKVMMTMMTVLQEEWPKIAKYASVDKFN